MFKSIMLLFMESSPDWRLWSYIAKILIILLCIAIIVIVSQRNSNTTFCKTCNRHVTKFQKYCNYCGSELTGDNKKVIIGVSKKMKTANILAIGILSMTIVFSIYQVATNFEFSSYGTGLYTELEQSYKSDENIWRIECTKALFAGSFHQPVNIEDISVSTLYIDSSSSFGTLVLYIKQGSIEDKIDISNTDGVLEYDLSKFNTELKIDFDIEHTKAKDIRIKINWE